MTVTLTAQEAATVRTAAWGAVSLLSAAGGSAHRVGVDAGLVLAAATGAVGHAVASAKGADLKGKSAAELADRVFPALTESVRLLKARDEAEAENFRGTIGLVVDAANRARGGEPGPALAEMARKIDAALDAA